MADPSLGVYVGCRNLWRSTQAPVRVCITSSEGTCVHDAPPTLATWSANALLLAEAPHPRWVSRHAARVVVLLCGRQPLHSGCRTLVGTPRSRQFHAVSHAPASPNSHCHPGDPRTHTSVASHCHLYTTSRAVMGISLILQKGLRCHALMSPR